MIQEILRCNRCAAANDVHAIGETMRANDASAQWAKASVATAFCLLSCLGSGELDVGGGTVSAGFYNAVGRGTVPGRPEKRAARRPAGRRARTRCLLPWLGREDGTVLLLGGGAQADDAL